MLLFVCHMSLTLTAVTLPAFLDLDHLNLPLMRKAGRSIYGQFGQSVPQRSLVMPVPLLFSWHCCTAVCLTRFFFVHRIPEVSCWVSMPRSTWWHFFSSRLWASATLNGINLVEVAERAAVRMHEPDFLEASPQGVLEIRAGDQTASKYDPFQCPARDVSAKHFTHFYTLSKDL